jgi:hypothetical protein
VSWWWLGFYDFGPTGLSPLGGAVVEADSLIEAVLRSRKIGANPGGAVMAMELKTKPPDCFVNRFLSVDEVFRGPN